MAEQGAKGKRGGKREGAGRKADPDALVYINVGATRRVWEYLARWSEDGNAGDCLAELTEQCIAAWPFGPNSNQFTKRDPHPTRPRLPKKRRGELAKPKRAKAGG